MKNHNLTEESKPPTQVIYVDFRRNRPAIDFDHYLDRVTEIHCRCCNHRRPRNGAHELMESWGYVCKCCLDNKAGSVSTSSQRDAVIQLRI